MRRIAADLIDYTLELSVLGSFSRIGLLARSRLHNWQDPANDALRGRVAIVTGPTSGIGRVVAEELAELGARVVLVARNPDKLEALRSDLIERHGEDRFPAYVADMSSLASVRSAAQAMLESEARLDILIDNAGAMFDERGQTDDGIERSLAVLAVGPFLLTELLMPRLRESDDARVIAVTSGGMYTQSVRLDDLDWTDREYSGPRAYAQAKRIQVTLIREWARRTRGSSVSFNAMHPGWVDTPGVAGALPGFYDVMGPLLRTPAEGADTILWLAWTDEIIPPGGLLYLDRRSRPFDRIPQTRLDAADRHQIWERMTDLAGGG